MTTTSNIFVGISAWAPSTSYAVGNRRSNGGNAYQCIAAGTSASSGGPSGTGSSITDGGAKWKFLASVDYVTIASWASGIPGALTQPVVGQLWDCGAITTTAGTEYFSLSGHTTSSTNTITLKAAPGESFRDFLLASPNPALAFNSSNGVRFVLPNATGSTNYVTVSDPNVIFDGLQFQDPDSSSNCSIIAVREPGNLALRHCIIDGYCQPGGTILDIAAPINMSNCLFVDRQATSGAFGVVVQTYNAANNSPIVNCSFIAVNGGITTNGCIQNQVTGVFARNCVFIGYSNPVDPAGSVAITIDHSATDSSSFGSAGTFTNGTGNLTGITPSNQFVNTTSDFRLKLGSSLILAGISDSTDVPTSDDIAGHTRLGWDPGAWEYTSSSSGSISFGALRASGSATLVPPPISANGRSSLTVLAAHGTATKTDFLSGAVRLFFMRASAAATISSGAASGNTPWSAEFSSDFGPIINAIPFNVVALISSVNPVAIVILQQPVTAASSFNILVSGAASVSNASARLIIMALTASGQATQLGATSNMMTLSCVSVATPLPKFVGSAHIDWQFLVGPMTSSTNSHTSSTSVLVLQSSSVVTQGNSASSRITIPLLSVSASIGTSCSAAVSLPPIAIATASASLFNLASGVASIVVLSTPKPTPPLLETDNNNDPFTGEFTTEFGPLAGSSLFIAADGSGLILAADIFQPSSTSSTSASGLVSIPALAASAASLFQIFWSGSVPVERISAAAQLQQIDSLSGTAVIPSIRAVGSSVQRNSASGAASLERLTAAALFGQNDAAIGLATIPPLSAFGSVPVLASALAQVLPISGVGFAGEGDPAFAFASLGDLSVKAFISDWSYGASSWVIGASGQAVQSNRASAAYTVLQLATNTSTVSSTNASAIASVAGISASCQAAQFNLASSVSTVLPLACVATSPDWSLGTNTILTLSAAGFGGSGDPAFSINNFFPISSIATGTAPLGSTCVATLLPLAAIGAVSLGAIGSASIGISSTASLGQSDGATASASINLVAAGSISNWCLANASIGLSAAGSISQTSFANGTGIIQWSASGHGLSSSGAACVAMIPTLSASAHAGLFLYAIGLSSLPSINATGAISDWAYGSATIPSVRSTAGANQLSSMSGSGTIPSIVAAGSAILSDVAAGRGAILTLSASGTAINDIRLAQATETIMALASSATAAVNGASVAGSASIAFNANGVITSAVEAAVLVELEQIVAAHAKLWITPTGYEQGDQVVYWND